MCQERFDDPFPPYCYELSTSALEALSASVLTDHLPNLRVFHTRLEKAVLFLRMMPTFFNPNLSNIHFNGPYLTNTQDTSTAYVHMLRRLSTDVPDLSIFSINPIFGFSNIFVSHISSVICSFRYLCYVSTDSVPITSQALSHLAALPCLTVLRTRLLDRDKDTFITSFKAPFGEVCFPQLRVLVLVRQDSLPVLSALIRATSSSNLQGLNVELKHADIPVHDLRDVFCALAEGPSRNHLTDLRIANFTMAGPAKPTQPVVDEDILAPLAMLDSLSSLIFDTPTVPFFINNKTFGRLVRSWPKIRRLHLGLTFPPTPSGRAPATLDALIFVSHFCPHLLTLTLPLNPRSSMLMGGVVMRERRPALCAERHALVALDIGRSPISSNDVLPTAAFLSGAFPALKDIDTEFACEDELDNEDLSSEERRRIGRTVRYRRHWNRVLELHPEFVIVRKQEREWGRRRRGPACSPVRSS